MNKKTKKCSVEISLTSLTSENLFLKKKKRKKFSNQSSDVMQTFISFTKYKTSWLFYREAALKMKKIFQEHNRGGILN